MATFIVIWGSIGVALFGVVHTDKEIMRDQNHFFVDNFADISNQKLENVSFESYK